MSTSLKSHVSSGKEEHKRAKPVIYNAIAGSLSGATSTIVLYPLDVVKVRLQVQNPLFIQSIPQYRGVAHALSTIIRTEGVLALYQGLLPNLCAASIGWGIYFYSYNFFKRIIKKSHFVNDKEIPPGFHMLAASGAGIMTGAFTNPFWLVKTRVQLQVRNNHGNYKGMFDAFRTILKEEGIVGLYRGMIPGFFGVLQSGLQFMTYEEMRRLVIKHKYHGDHHKMNTGDWLLIGGLAKMFSATTTYPYQVIRSRIQERPIDNVRKYAGIKDVIVKTMKAQGVRGFYRGLLPYLIKVAPASGITFTVYENIMRILP